MIDDKMVVNITDGTEEEFIAAFEDIKHYLELIFSLNKKNKLYQKNI
jgi:hypothetical protein